MRMATPKWTRAWVIRWEWMGDHAAVDQSVAAILRRQTGAEQVRRIVEMLHAARQYAPDEMLFAIRRNGHNRTWRSSGQRSSTPVGAGRPSA
jgi:hypothetical protein